MGEVAVSADQADVAGGAERDDKVRIKGVSADFICKRAVIGVTDEKIKNADFQALLPAGIFQNNISDKGEDYEEAKRFLV